MKLNRKISAKEICDYINKVYDKEEPSDHDIINLHIIQIASIDNIGIRRKLLLLKRFLESYFKYAENYGKNEI